MRNYLNYAYKVILFSLILIGTALLFRYFLKPVWIHDKIGTLVWFYFILNLVTGLFTQYLVKINEGHSVSILLGTSVIRLLASLCFVFVILWTGTENLLWFVVNFFIIYLLYLLFDIYLFITNLRPHSE